MRNNYTLECCVDSTQSAICAKEGGADRLELCANLVIGGTTPTLALFEQIRRTVDIRIHVLIRPRFGDFLYSPLEAELICEEISAFRAAGADGVVIGSLLPDGSLNMEQMKILMEEAGDMSVTLHRAFDVCADPYETLEQAVSLGIDTILTSGQKNICTLGTDLLKDLVDRSAGRIVIQVGSGVNADVIEEVYPKTGARAYHMSGKITLDSTMKYRKEGVNMGLPSISEYEIWRTDEEAVRKARQVLDRLQGE